MSIQKIYTFCYYNTIKINVFPCIEIQSIGNYDSEDQHPYTYDEFEKKYNKSLKGLKNEIEQIISYPTKNMYDQKEALFLFCFDLSDFNTFENIPLYFSEINNKFNITNNFHMALIGNKNDKKKILKVQQQNILDNFIQKINIKYYEVSSLLNFKFELFFEKLFFDIFEYNKSNNYNNYNIKDFKEKFHIIINERSNFSKSQRALNIKNDLPSPQEYNNKEKGMAYTGFISDPKYARLDIAQTVKGNWVFGDYTPTQAEKENFNYIASGNWKFKNVIDGTAMYANWGDLAEIYQCDTDEVLVPGTVIKLGGKFEITKTRKNDRHPFGIISTNPGVVLNKKETKGQKVALVGRVPVRIIGKINKFDKLTTSYIPGVAKKKTFLDTLLLKPTIGKCLHTDTNENEKLVEAIVKINI